MYETTTTEVRFPGGGGDIQAWFTRPVDDGRYPAIAMFHDRYGVSEPFKDCAARFAEEGIVALAVNHMTYATGPLSHESGPSAEDKLRTVGGALEFLKGQECVAPGQTVLAGYCAGGRIVYAGLAEQPTFDAGVIWHGGIMGGGGPEQPFDAARRIDVPMLIIHGTADTNVPLDQVFQLTTRLNDLCKRFELKLYSGTDHSFTLPGMRAYDPENADDAFREAVLYVRRTFGIPVGTVGPLIREPVAP